MMDTQVGRPFGLGGYVTGTRKVGTRPNTFGLARYTTATAETISTRIPTLWTKKARKWT